MVVNSSTFDFSDVVRTYLARYGALCADAMWDACVEVANESVKKLRQASAAQFGKGDYSKGWTRTLDKARYVRVATVHGRKPTYALAHLLEHGHVTRNGTNRTYAPTPAHPHIAEVEAWAIDEAINRTIEKLEGVE